MGVPGDFGGLGGPLDEHVHEFERELDGGRDLLEALHLVQGGLVEPADGFFSLEEDGQGFVEGVVGLALDELDFVVLHVDDLLLVLHDLLLFGTLGPVYLDDLLEFGLLDSLLLEDGLEEGEVLLHFGDFLVGGDELGEACEEGVAAVAEERPLLVEEGLVGAEEVEVGLGRRVDFAFELLVEGLGLGVDGLVDEHAGAGEQFLEFVLFPEGVDGADELLGDGEQRVLGPGVEPVDGAAVYERREHSQSLSQLVAHRRETQDDGETVANA